MRRWQRRWRRQQQRRFPVLRLYQTHFMLYTQLRSSSAQGTLRGRERNDSRQPSGTRAPHLYRWRLRCDNEVSRGAGGDPPRLITHRHPTGIESVDGLAPDSSQARAGRCHGVRVSAFPWQRGPCQGIHPFNLRLRLLQERGAVRKGSQAGAVGGDDGGGGAAGGAGASAGSPAWSGSRQPACRCGSWPRGSRACGCTAAEAAEAGEAGAAAAPHPLPGAAGVAAPCRRGSHLPGARGPPPALTPPLRGLRGSSQRPLDPGSDGPAWRVRAAASRRGAGRAGAAPGGAAPAGGGGSAAGGAQHF